jgi:hypothetical protein
VRTSGRSASETWCARVPFGIALIVAGIAGIILGIVGAHTGNPTIGEQKWYWLVTAISLLPTKPRWQ